MDAKVAMVQGMYAAFGRGDINALASAVTQDSEWVGGGSDPKMFPSFGVRKGPQGVKDFFATLDTLRDFESFDIREFHASGDKVFVLGHYVMTMRASRRKAASDFVHIFTFTDGKVSAFREFLDTAAVVDAHRAPASP